MALLLNNIAQLKQILLTVNKDLFGYAGAFLVCVSIILQLVIGALIIMQTYWERNIFGNKSKSNPKDTTASSNSTKDTKEDSESDKIADAFSPKMRRISTAITILVFVLLVLNVAITGLDLNAVSANRNAQKQPHNGSSL